MTEASPEMRSDPVTGEWVIFAPERARRPGDLTGTRDEPTPIADCDYCRGRVDGVRVLSEERSGEAGPRPSGPGLGPPPATASIGAGSWHDVVVESSRHDLRLVEMEAGQLAGLLGLYRERMRLLASRLETGQVILTRDTGPDAGARTSHPHGHVHAVPLAGGRLADEAGGFERHQDEKGVCVYCDILREAGEDRARLVARNDRFLAFTPWAAKFPHEVAIAPLCHAARFETGPDEEIPFLADIMKLTMRAIERCLDRPSSHLVLHTAPVRPRSTPEAPFHWHVEITPRPTRVAGFEWGTGIYINPLLPEESARRLRAQISPSG